MTKSVWLVLLLGIMQGYAYPVAAGTEAELKLKQVTLAVQNMSCGMCKYTVENALKQVAGVKSANVDMDRKIAVVDFDPAKVGVEDLAKAVSDAGYPATVVE